MVLEGGRSRWRISGHLVSLSMWCAVGTQEEFGGPAGGCCKDSLAMPLPLQDRQAEQMGPEPTLQTRAAFNNVKPEPEVQRRSLKNANDHCCSHGKKVNLTGLVPVKQFGSVAPLTGHLLHWGAWVNKLYMQTRLTLMTWQPAGDKHCSAIPGT